jgi:hypothetical protein
MAVAGRDDHGEGAGISDGDGPGSAVRETGTDAALLTFSSAWES